MTFHFEAPVVAGDVLKAGGPRVIGIFGPNPFVPFGPVNAAVVRHGSALACSGEPPSADMASARGTALPVLVWLLLTALLGIGLVVRRAASTR
jgi:hypothetical protein